MITSDPKDEIFSYHLVKLSFFAALRFFVFPPRSSSILGLKYSLCLFTMNLGKPVFSFARYKFTTLALIAWWENEDLLDSFLRSEKYLLNTSQSWHLRMRPYRRWGTLTGLDDAYLFTDLKDSSGPIAALTVAKLRLSQTIRFTKWGKPVESQVDKHKGKKLALVSMRPPQMFSTFSIWKTEEEMLNMIEGKTLADGKDHKEAMRERSRKPFHHEFTTLRFQPVKEAGEFDGQSQFLSSDKDSN